MIIWSHYVVRDDNESTRIHSGILGSGSGIENAWFIAYCFAVLC